MDITPAILILHQSFADCRESWDVLYPVRRNVDIQHVYGKYDTAGRFGIVRILWY